MAAAANHSRGASEMVVSERAFEELDADRDRPGEAIRGLVQLYRRYRKD